MPVPVELLWGVAVSMAAVTAWLIKRTSRVATLYDGSVMLFLLTMMVAMFVSAVYYIYVPSITTLFVLFAANMVSMSIFLVPIVASLMYGGKKLDDFGVGGLTLLGAFQLAAVALVMAAEVFMGWAFTLASGAITPDGSSAGIYSALVGSIGSYWFVFTMAGEMAITLYLLRDRLQKAVWTVVGAQVLIMLFSPTAINSSDWARYSTYLASVVMIVLFIYVFEFLFRNRSLERGTSDYLVRILLAYGIMMAGIFAWLLFGNEEVFALSLLVEMAVYFSAVIRNRESGSGSESWQSRPLWVFAVLSFLFVAEFFMGAAIDVYAYGTAYFTSLPLVPIAGSILGAMAAAGYDFITYFSAVTASVWYLVMMGIEMGALVLFKIRYSRELETKVRLGMVIVAYAVYAVFLPYFVFPSTARYIPWIGWSMGVGTAGALAPAVALALLGTYFASGLLSFFFGSRNVCSVFCTAALMYQGTAIDSMSSFNRTSKLGRRFLTSRLSATYKWVVSVVWFSLVAAAMLSYLNSIGVIDVTVFGADTSFFTYSFYFSFLWYIVWILIPFMGTYACATTGMCGWGSFNQLISRFGLFKLKVKDSDTCVTCATKDCAKVCPVGITDQPGSFIGTGQLKTMRCIGVGDCVTACPYQNIYFYDIRAWLRARLRGAKSSAALGASLPVVRAGYFPPAGPYSKDE
ncbi:MAG: 4Fe-4S dicluster domain-containing protein [Nitrososphaerota archaeon]|jgi:polyferredoxin|nr:4Fe-4S dicluster domain-containing protein [Nitrososphaerota archaeon]MDG6903861.1 4Fe-4S dicluster domain-containing protein [Nitrososphaerota archaeon]MDG6911507.1 4Fe-4S dicluster domain-containing protein [Nitrososphaerota archaeon]MDG6960723.1 4Fe-4S dicluster domain-containing protein [Nitrososphaerota archaeon]MDG6962392.1 4Fe-4S dicluster domain-containing protein [Nitrososphaerota archaeon]